MLSVPPNLLLVVLDDWGADMWSGGGATTAPPTPTIDRLAAEGVSFARAWSAPNCSPSRAALISGLPPHVTGIGNVLGCPNNRGLSYDVETMAERLSDAGYGTAMYGKWHVGVIRDELDPVEAADPVLQGFDHYAGAVVPGEHCATDGLPNEHYDWERCENGACERVTEYDTASQFDDAAVSVSSLPEPWFVFLSVYAPHPPYVAPPNLIDGGGITSSQRRYRSMVADVDARLGALLANVDPTDTFVVVVGDNGSPAEVRMPLGVQERSKGSVYEGGVHVPLVIRGPGVAVGALAQQPVHLTDLYATLTELAGRPLPSDHVAARTSRSLVPALRDPAGAEGRTVVFTEGFDVPVVGLRPMRTQQAVLDDSGWKLVRLEGCEGVRDPEAGRWVCDEPRVWGEPTLELYRVAEDGSLADGPEDNLLADGASPDELRIVSRLVAEMDSDFAPQTLPVW